MDDNLLTTTNNPSSLSEPKFKFASGATPKNIQNEPEGLSSTSIANIKGFNTLNTPDNLTGDLNVSVGESFSPAAIQSDTTIEDVLSERTRLEQGANQPTATQELDQIESSNSGSFLSDPQAFIDSFFSRDLSQAEKAQQDALDEMAKVTERIEASLTDTEREAREQTGIRSLEEELAGTNVDIAKRQVRYRNDLEALEGDAVRRGTARAFFEDRRFRIESEAQADLADLYIIQSAQQGNVQAAKDAIQTAVDNRYRYFENKLAAEQARLQALAPQLNREEKERNTKLQLAVSERQRLLEEQKATRAGILDMMSTAAANGAPQSVRDAILSAGSIEEAYRLGGQYIGLYDRMKAQADLAAKQMNNKMQLLELALNGDTNSKRQLQEMGVDIDGMLERQSTEEVEANNKKHTSLQTEYDRLSAQLLNNDVGLQNASGLVRSPFLSSTKGGYFLPGIVNYADTRQKQQAFLAGANNLVSSFALKTLVQLKEEGATFGALSDSEFQRIKESALLLSGIAITDDAGRITGFTDESLAKEYVDYAMQDLQTAIDEVNAELVPVDERREITNL